MDQMCKNCFGVRGIKHEQENNKFQSNGKFELHRVISHHLVVFLITGHTSFFLLPDEILGRIACHFG